MRSTLFTISIIILFSSCAINKLTGKNQLSLVSDEEILHSSDSLYKDYLEKHTVLNNGNDNNVQMVERVGKRIVKAVNKYYSDNVMQSLLNDYKWEYHLVQDSVINAWCMPGGKIVVYTGMLSMVNSEAELAIIMGHEVSHALLNHGKQRLSQAVLLNLGSLAVSTAVEKKSTRAKRNIEIAYGISTQIGLELPFSRKHEYEADKFGLLWAAMAGYDPNEAIPLWERMNENSVAIPQFLRTHPTELNRIEAIKNNMPEAMKYYKK
jgi:predicted Zn-dependent protease